MPGSKVAEPPSAAWELLLRAAAETGARKAARGLGLGLGLRGRALA